MPVSRTLTSIKAVEETLEICPTPYCYYYKLCCFSDFEIGEMDFSS